MKTNRKATCHPDRPLVARGLCSSCYRESQISKHVQSKCHPDRPEYVVDSGLCDTCCKLQITHTHVPSHCHPNRPEFVVGSGICKTCRNRELLSKRPPSRCHPDRPEYVKGSGVCGKSAIDHDHSTGALRGVLCSACNKMLGFAKDDPVILSKAIEYLHKYAKSPIEERTG